MKTLVVKEFLWNWRSFRFPAFLLVLLFHALVDPVTVRYMPEIMGYFADIDILLPPLAAEDAFTSYLSSISQLGILVLILITMGSVAKEKETGVAGWMLSKPVSRWRYLQAKVINLYAVILIGVLVSATVAYTYTWALLGQVDVLGAVWAVVGLLSYMLFIGSIAFLCSTALRSPLQAGGVSILIFFLLSALQLAIGKTVLGGVYPNTLLSEMAGLVHGVTMANEVMLPLISSLVLSGFMIGIAARVFSRAEL